jgi:hypothetical protein
MQGEGVLTRMPMTLETAELSKGGEDAETSKMQSRRQRPIAGAVRAHENVELSHKLVHQYRARDECVELAECSGSAQQRRCLRC